MIYKVIGLMSGSSLDGLDIAFTEFHENGGKWNYEIVQADCYPYSGDWVQRLKNATTLSALDYLLLHVEYGHYIGKQVNRFIEENGLHYQVALIASHGHTTFHLPSKKMTAQLGDGAAIASETRLPVVTDLRALDVALGGEGAPIVPFGEKLLLSNYDYFLNLGGIANISVRPHPKPLSKGEGLSDIVNEKMRLQFLEKSSPLSPVGEGGREDEVFIAFDICAANRVLNMLANQIGKEFDEDGKIAAGGNIHAAVLEKINELDYYKQPYPKSLANDFGTDIVFPILQQAGLSIPDAMRTYTEHIVVQIKNSLRGFIETKPGNRKLLVTGGGALNTFLIERLKQELQTFNIEITVPDKKLVNYKEAMIMGFIGILRWRQEYNILSSVTGSSRDSINGALWTGQEA